MDLGFGACPPQLAAEEASLYCPGEGYRSGQAISKLSASAAAELNPKRDLARPLPAEPNRRGGPPERARIIGQAPRPGWATGRHRLPARPSGRLETTNRRVSHRRRRCPTPEIRQRGP